MQYRLVTETNRQIKQLSYQMLKGKIFEALCVVALNYIIGNAANLFVRAAGDSMFTMVIGYSYLLFTGGPLYLGLAAYFLKLFRGEKTGVFELLYGFRDFRKATVLYLMIVLRVALLSFLLVIPGIIAAFSCSQAFRIMADNPELSPAECIVRSQQIMMGNKARLASLVMSFALFLFISLLPQIIEFYLRFDPAAFTTAEEIESFAMTYRSGLTPTVISTLIQFALLVCFKITNCCFYDLMNGNLTVMEDPSNELQSGNF